MIKLALILLAVTTSPPESREQYLAQKREAYLIRKAEKQELAKVMVIARKRTYSILASKFQKQSCGMCRTRPVTRQEYNTVLKQQLNYLRK